MLLVVITALFGILCGCSQEDDGYDNADMYTLAEMGTRLVGKGDPGSGKKRGKLCSNLSLQTIQIPKVFPQKRNLSYMVNTIRKL